MNILTKAFQEITFDDVVECCRAETLESAVLDYKKSMPGDLSKHFATFSNTHGGLIIIGVEEDSVTGKPKTYEGIVFDGKLIDQVHQFASNVSPFPRYEVRATDEKAGKIFLLVKIFEGDQPPYMSNSDSTIRLRTGNISTPLRNADSRELEKLHEKKARAQVLRQDALASSDLIYRAALDRAIGEWKEKRQLDPSSVSKHEPAEIESPFRVTIMPISPSEAIVNYRFIKDKLDEYRVRTRFYRDFPELNVETMPGGIMFAAWSWIDSDFRYGEVTEKGVIDSVVDVLSADPTKGIRQIAMGHMVSNLVRQLEVAKKFYNLIGFNGLLTCRISLDKAKGVAVYGPLPDGWQRSSFGSGSELTKLGSYEWEVANLDTVKLNDIESLSTEVLETVERFYWDFGMHTPNKDMLKEYLKQQGWKTP
ncbi:MAG TPA: ATP-binding protein [Candidatus Saccharimonadia bacterium]|nr:ATP-binding protein [Candidatus Saccharimonadia bacterium]